MPLTPIFASLEERKTSAKRPLVLVVEDQPAIQDMIAWALHLKGYRSVGTTNGQEALEWIEQARQTGDYPVVILLDLFMPVMNGSTFLANLRTRWDAPLPIPPVILLTVDKSNHEHLACHEVLTKPFHIHDLCDSLRRVSKL
jgi:CheY-like chemotaxis protein